MARLSLRPAFSRDANEASAGKPWDRPRGSASRTTRPAAAEPASPWAMPSMPPDRLGRTALPSLAPRLGAAAETALARLSLRPPAPPEPKPWDRSTVRSGPRPRLEGRPVATPGAWDIESTLSPTTSATPRGPLPATAAKGASPLRQLAFGACLALACVTGLAAFAAKGVAEGHRIGLSPGALALLARAALLPEREVKAAIAPEPAPVPAPPAPRADAALDRQGRSHVAGGLLSLPPGFRSEDGSYDLVLHFHGNPNVVEESYATLPLNAAVVVFNVGISSRPYEERFASPAFLSGARERARAVLEARGLVHPRERRVALSAWSAGYAAVARVLESPRAEREVDAVLLLDGMHSNFLPDGSVDPSRIASLFRFAERAARGDALFVITHSEIDPREYAGVKKATDALLASLGVPRTRPGPAPAMPDLESVKASVSKSKRWPMRPRSQAKKGGLVVRHYAGEKAEDHMGHLLQMRAIALPELAARWGRGAP